MSGAPPAPPLLKTSYQVKASIASLYTGGKVLVSGSEDFLVCMCGSAINFISFDTVKIINTIAEEHESYTSFALSPDDTHLVTAAQSQMLKMWNVASKEVVHQMKISKAPVLDVVTDHSGLLVATAQADGTVKVWDMERGHCTHNFIGHSGVVLRVLFHPDPKRLLLVSTSEDSTVRVWDLRQSGGIVLDNHMAAVSSLAFSATGDLLLTGGRDKVVNAWSMKDMTCVKTIPVLEALEGVGVVTCTVESGKKGNKKATQVERLITAGDKGVLRLWSIESKELILEEPANPAGYTLASMTMCRRKGVAIAVTSEQNLMFYDASTLQQTKLLVGSNDDIIDLRYTLGGKGIVAATNSPQLRHFSLADHSCAMLSGHEGVVLAMDASRDGRLLVSGGKDATARVWDLSTNSCLGVCVGHTEAIGAVAVARTTPTFAITGSKDKTIKIWDLSAVSSALSSEEPAAEEPAAVRARLTQKAHDKDINCIAIAPNDALFASGSQDKTIKLWTVADMKTVGILKGHRRGIWCVEFSPVEQVLASSSADKTVKIWSVKDHTCLRTLEAHDSSVLRVAFVTAGMQLLTTSSDGLMKLWTIKSNDCVGTFDAHTDKIWALAVRNDGAELVTGGSDSLINVWGDHTLQEREDKAKKAEAIVLAEQELSNSLQQRDFPKAVRLAFRLDQPARMLRIMQDLCASAPQLLATIVADFTSAELLQCLKFIRDWNTNAKFSWVAQRVLGAILQQFPPAVLQRLPQAAFKECLVALIPYTEKHFQRIAKLQQRSYLIDHVLQSASLLPPPAATQPTQKTMDVIEPISFGSHQPAVGLLVPAEEVNGTTHAEQLPSVDLGDEGALEEALEQLGDSEGQGLPENARPPPQHKKKKRKHNAA